MVPTPDTRLETLARVVRRKLSYLARRIERAGVRDTKRHSMRELAAIALGEELRRARAAMTARRRQANASKRWVAGCPHLLGEWQALATQFPSVAREWDRARNGSLTPETVAAHSHWRAWWRCARDPAHRWQASVDDRTSRSSRCPVCTGKAPILRGDAHGRLNSFADEFPELARQWDPRRNRRVALKDVSYDSHYRAWWRCPRDPSHCWQAEVTERTRGSGCPYCAGKRRARAPLAAVAAMALAAASFALGCDKPSTNVVFDNQYAADSGDVIYQAQWSAVAVSTPVPPGMSSAPADSVPASANTAWVALAPGWDPTSMTPPTSFVVLRSASGFDLHINNTLHIPVDDSTFVGNCAAGSTLSQDEADFITQRVFQGAFIGLTYDASTCTTSMPAPTDGGM